MTIKRIVLVLLALAAVTIGFAKPTPATANPFFDRLHANASTCQPDMEQVDNRSQITCAMHLIDTVNGPIRPVPVDYVGRGQFGGLSTTSLAWPALATPDSLAYGGYVIKVGEGMLEKVAQQLGHRMTFVQIVMALAHEMQHHAEAVNGRSLGDVAARRNTTANELAADRMGALWTARIFGYGAAYDAIELATAFGDGDGSHGTAAQRTDAVRAGFAAA